MLFSPQQLANQPIYTKHEHAAEVVQVPDLSDQTAARFPFQIGTFFPSSKTCNGCKFVLDKLPLNIRQWTCPNCDQENDRDLNAARNIRDQGVISSMSGQGTGSDIKQKLAEAPASKAGLRNKKPRP
jgi:putative transposase